MSAGDLYRLLDFSSKFFVAQLFRQIRFENEQFGLFLFGKIRPARLLVAFHAFPALFGLFNDNGPQFRILSLFFPRRNQVVADSALASGASILNRVFGLHGAYYVFFDLFS